MLRAASAGCAAHCSARMEAWAPSPAVRRLDTIFKRACSRPLSLACASRGMAPDWGHPWVIELGGGLLSPLTMQSSREKHACVRACVGWWVGGWVRMCIPGGCELQLLQCLPRRVGAFLCFSWKHPGCEKQDEARTAVVVHWSPHPPGM